MTPPLTTYWSGEYTREQLQKVISAWGVEDDLPNRGRQLLIAFPYGFDARVAIITKGARKGTDGRLLYRLELQR